MMLQDDYFGDILISNHTLSARTTTLANASNEINTTTAQYVRSAATGSHRKSANRGRKMRSLPTMVGLTAAGAVLFVLTLTLAASASSAGFGSGAADTSALQPAKSHSSSSDEPERATLALESSKQIRINDNHQQKQPEVRTVITTTSKAARDASDSYSDQNRPHNSHDPHDHDRRAFTEAPSGGRQRHRRSQQQMLDIGSSSSILEADAELGSSTGAISHQYPSGPQAQALVTSNPLIRTVNPGDSVYIPCSLANMGGSIQFAKDDRPIILDSGCAQCQLDISNDGQASLKINRVSTKDQGQWQCWRLDANGKVKQKIPIIQLVIMNSPELPFLMVNDKQLLAGTSADSTITTKENEIVEVRCVIKGAASPVDYVHWMLDSSQNVTHLSQLMMEYSPQENNYLTQSVLKLNATKPMNLKSISCLSNHQLWLTPMTVTAFLNVLYEPSFTISREPGFGIQVSEGMTVILKCEIDSNPSSSPIWIKDADNKTAGANGNADQQQMLTTSQGSSKEAGDEPIVLSSQEDGSVIFQPAQRSDSGWYRCKTESKYGNFSSFGYYLNVSASSSAGGASSHALGGSSPPLSALAQRYHPPAGRSQHQHQQPPAAPTAAAGNGDFFAQPSRIMAPNQPAAQASRLSPPIVSNMMNNDQPSQPSGGNSPFHQQPQPQPHTSLQQAQPFSSAALGEAQGGAGARCRGGTRAEGFPEIDQPISTVQAVLGRQLILPLRFCCNPGPARVFWIHRHLAMIPGRMFGPYITRDLYTSYNSLYCYESTFEIESVKPEDIGTVYVFVSNEKGHAGAQISIQLAKTTNSNGQQSSSLGSRFHLTSSAASSQSGASLPMMQLATLALLTIAHYAYCNNNYHQ